MDNKQQTNQNRNTTTGGNCNAPCQKCGGKCSQNSTHNGPHHCNGGHDWKK